LVCVASATPSTSTEVVVQRVIETIDIAFRTQDYSDLNDMCAGGSFTSYINQLLGSFPDPQLLASLNSFASCVLPICTVVNDPCWTQLEANLPTGDGCVPGLASASSLIQSACTSGCLNTLNPYAQTTVTCLANWAGSNSLFSLDLEGLGFTTIDFTPVASSSNFLCQQNPSNGVYCLSQLTDTSLLVYPGDPTNPANCPYFQSLGCCAGLGRVVQYFQCH